jgi:hypothetical protein
MDTNLAAWMISGGPRTETQAAEREREQLHAFRQAQRTTHVDRPGIVARIRSFARPAAAAPAPTLDCCPA